MPDGVQTNLLPDAVTLDSVIGNREGSTVKITIERLIALLAALMGPTYGTRAALYADLAWPAGSIGYVRADGTTAFNGVYKKAGASGAGSWARVGDLPSGAVEASQLAALEAAVLLKASLASPALTGTPTAPTATVGTNTAQVATTAFVKAALDAILAAAPGALDTLNELAAALGNDANFAASMTAALAAKAPLASPALTGTPTAPTATVGTNTAQVATTAFVKAAVDVEAARAQGIEAGLVTDLSVRALRYVVPAFGDAVTMQISASGVAVEVETEFLAKGGPLKPQLYVVPRIGQAQAVTLGAGGLVLAAVGEFGEAVTAFAQGDLTADVAQVEERPTPGAVTGRSLRQVFLRRSESVYVALTGGHLPARLLSADPAAGVATVRRGGASHVVKWRPTPLGAGGTLHLVLGVGQSLKQGHVDSDVAERMPFWRDPVAERAHQFRAGDGVQRGCRVLQVRPVASNKAVVLAAGQIAALEPLRGSLHADDEQYAQTDMESLALALIGQHLHRRDQVLAAIVGTGSTAIADFAVASNHYVSAQAVITAAAAQAVARSLALKVWLVWNQGEEDNDLGTLQATYVSTWRAIRAGLSTHTVSAGGTFGGTVIQQTLQRPSGVTGMATLAHAELIVAGDALAVVPQTCQPGYSGSTHLSPLTYLPLGAATGLQISRMLEPSAIAAFVGRATKGAYFTPRHMRSLSQVDSAGTPLTAVNQAVGRIEGVGPSGVVAFSQVTGGSRPAYNAGGRIKFDGTADHLDADAAIRAIAQAADVVTFVGRFRTGGSFAATQLLWAFSTAGTVTRAALTVNTNGALFLSSRRFDADIQVTSATDPGVVALNSEYSVISVLNYAAGTCGIYINGGANAVISATLPFSGPTENLISQRARLGSVSGVMPGAYFSGSHGRFAFANVEPTADERAAMFAELALDPAWRLDPHVGFGDAVLITGTQIDCKISGGSGAYVFDTSTMIADAAGTYGVRVENDSGPVAISAIALVGGTVLRITLGASVALASTPRVEFGLFGPANMIGAAASRVNIRDASAWICPCTGQIISGWMLHHRVSVT